MTTTYAIQIPMPLANQLFYFPSFVLIFMYD